MAYGTRDRQPTNVTPFRRFAPDRWQDQPVPPRRWLVDGILARGSVTLLTGDGGIGKSLLMQQLQTAIALGGEHWAGIELPPDPIVSFGIYCEDDENELHRRQANINAAYGIEMKTLGSGIHFASRVGEDNILAYFSREDRATPTAFFEQISNTIRETGAQLIIIDTAADAFGGNENYRAQVRSFINLLRRWPMEMDGGVILTAHPSNFGMTQGTGISGSTAWANSVRARIYLTKPKDDVDEYGEQEDTNERVLKLMKSNYGPSGNQIRLRWEHGIFAPVNRGGSNTVDRLALDATIMREMGNLIADGARVLAFDRATRGFLKLMKERPALKQWSPGEIAAAKDRLMEHGRLVRVVLGTKRHPETCLRPADALYPEERT